MRVGGLLELVADKGRLRGESCGRPKEGRSSLFVTPLAWDDARLGGDRQGKKGVEGKAGFQKGVRAWPLSSSFPLDIKPRSAEVLPESSEPC